MPVWEMVRNASFCIRLRVIASATTLARIRVRKSPAIRLSETSSVNARSVVASSRWATGMRSAS